MRAEDGAGRRRQAQTRPPVVLPAFSSMHRGCGEMETWANFVDRDDAQPRQNIYLAHRGI